MRIDIGQGVRLFVDIEGASLEADGATMREKPTLLLLHGGPGFDHAGFKPAFSQLSDIAQIVYYDHRGHGRSDRRPSEEWTLDNWADDVVRLCDALGVSKPIVLGQSFGGFVAQHYLARHPGHASKVILSSTSPHMGLERKLVMFERLGGERARAVAQSFWTAPDADKLAEYWEVCHSLYNQHHAPNGDAAKRVIRNDDILLHFVSGEMQGLNLLAGLAKAQCPVLVMAGEMDPVCPLADSQDIAAALPSQWGRLATFANSGHGAWRDEAEAAFALLREFITAPV
jgi:proline iminopeptidase